MKESLRGLWHVGGLVFVLSKQIDGSIEDSFWGPMSIRIKEVLALSLAGPMPFNSQQLGHRRAVEKARADGDVARLLDFHIVISRHGNRIDSVMMKHDEVA